MFAVLANWLIFDSEQVEQDTGFIVSEGKILKLLPNEQILAEAQKYDCEVLDYRNKLICPGFVNTHMHQYGVLSHGMTPKIQINSFDSFLEDYWWPDLENKVDLKDILVTTKYTALELLESGVVAFFDVLEAPLTEKGSLIEQGKIIEKMGMRAFVSLESSERISHENGVDCLQENVEAIRYFKQHSHLVKAALSTHTSFTCSDAFIREAVQLAVENKALLHFHLSESAYEPKKLKEKRQITPVELYEQLGALSENVLASQCVKVSEKEIDILRKAGVHVSHMPISNCEVGGGVAPVPQMLKAGIKVGLGTDGYINDFFAVMRAAFLIHKAHLESTSVMPAKLVFKMATEYGASCLGYQGGCLREGYPADFIVMDEAWPTPLNKQNIYDQIVVFGKKEYVKEIFVAGKSIFQRDEYMQNHSMVDLIKQIRAYSQEIWNNQNQ